MTDKVLFLDIDGVLLPRRMYNAPNQTRPLVTVFDPGVVGMVNTLAKECGYKFVIHSSWLRSSVLGSMGITDVKSHMVSQGLKKEYFHEDHSCLYRFSGTRWHAILDWLEEHPEVEDYWILEDEPCHGYDWSVLKQDRIMTTEFNEGLTYNQFCEIRYGKDTEEYRLHTGDYGL